MADTDEILKLNQQLLTAIAGGDWETYEKLCHPGLTCFEPEAAGHLVQGLDFHRFYFDLGRETPTVASNRVVTTMASPQVWMLGPDAALVAYVRLVQQLGPTGPRTAQFEETRVWRCDTDGWRHIHFHRSVGTKE